MSTGLLSPSPKHHVSRRRMSHRTRAGRAWCKRTSLVRQQHCYGGHRRALRGAQDRGRCGVLLLPNSQKAVSQPATRPSVGFTRIGTKAK